MEDKLTFKHDAFIYFMQCSIDHLKIEIGKARNSVNQLRKQPARFPKDVDNYNMQYERLEVLQLLEKFRLKEIDKATFDSKVNIDMNQLYQ